MQETVTARGGFLPTVVGALTLRDEVYRAAGDDPQPIRRGLIFVVAVGLISAAASVIGAALSWWTTPNMTALKETVASGVLGMPWAKQLPPEALAEAQKSMNQTMDMVFGIIGAVMPSVPKALTSLITQPLGMVLFWLVFGALAFVFAHLLAGKGTLSQTLGATALAAAPAILGVVQVVPNVTVAGLTTWSLVCMYLALKNTHRLTPGRAFWATLLPIVTLGLFLVLLAGGVAAVVAFVLSAGGGTR
jgi:hypothetical protein